MKNKKILIFGGGINQLTLIQACNDLGFNSVVIDPGLNPPGKKLANVFEVVGTADYEKTKEIAQRYKVDGIATSQMENPLRLMAKLANELDFLFNSPKIIERSLNKYLMKKAFIENNIPYAKGIFYDGKDSLLKKGLEELEFPLIIKPVDSHSSRGVYKVDSLEQIMNHIDETISFSKSGSFLIEEYIEGFEYSIESVTFNKITTIVQFTEKIITPLPNVVELGHIQPACLSKGQKKEISKVVIEGIKALGLDNTVCHTEVKLSNKGPVIIEIGPRMGGDFISSYLVKHSIGVNLDKATIQMSVGVKPDVKPKMNQFSSIQYLQLETGKRIKSIGNWEKVLEMPGVLFANISIKAGEIVSKITDSAKRPGFVIVEGVNRKIIDDASSACLQFLKDEIHYC